jgi:hypothetical protein
MKIDWMHKWMIINCYGVSVQLLGMQSSLSECALIEVSIIGHQQSLSSEQCLIQTEVHPQIQELMTRFDHLFKEPSELPPRRAYDHYIPLVSGAQPVNVRPYRFSPDMKNEVENQVHDMLSKELIQHSRGLSLHMLC